MAAKKEPFNSLSEWSDIIMNRDKTHGVAESSALRKPDRKTIRLAVTLEARLGEPTITQLYDSIRRTVYGVPGSAISLEDLIHELAELLGKPDPSGLDD